MRNPHSSKRNTYAAAKRLIAGFFFLWMCLFGVLSEAEECAKPQTTDVLEGIVTFTGEVPFNPVRDNEGRRGPLFEVDAKSGALEQAVVYIALEGDVPALAGAPEQSYHVDQFDQRFVPHVIAVRASEPVRFTNSDFHNHNVRASTEEPKNEFNVITTPTRDYTKEFIAQAEPIRLSCDIHQWMGGWVYVFDHPYFAATGEDGRFRIGNVPTGEHKVVVRQPDKDMYATGTVRVDGGTTTQIRVEFTEEHFGGDVPGNVKNLAAPEE